MPGLKSPRRLFFLVLVLCVSGAIGLWIYLWGLTPAPVELSNNYQTAERVSFFALGDQGTGDFSQWRVARSMETVAEKTSDVDFVLLLGDNFYGSAPQSTRDKWWNYKFENMYSGPKLDSLPFFAVLGNRDTGTNADAQLAYAREKAGSGRWQMPARDYSKDFGLHNGNPLLRIVFIDTTAIDPEAVREQVEFIHNAFEAAPRPVWRFVAAHHTLRSFGKHSDDARVRSALLPLLQEKKVDVYLSAHDHNRQIIAMDGEPYYVISGGGGKTLYNVQDLQKGLLYAEKEMGFAKLVLDARQMEITYYDDGANAKVRFSVQRACVDAASVCMKPVPLVESGLAPR